MSNLTRSRNNKIFAGVAAGIAKKFDFDVSIVRIVFMVAGIFLTPFAVGAYFALWVILPEEGSNITGLDHLRSGFTNRT